MGIPQWKRMPCETCHGTGRDPKKRKRECSKCRGSGEGDHCAICRRKIIYEMSCFNTDEDYKECCKCQRIPLGCI